MNTSVKMSHDELASDLAQHLRGGSQRITWEDMQLGPAGSPRPDVYAMEPTYSRLSFEAFEIKVSTSDFRSDVTSGKWQSYLRYANSVTFAAPLGLITKDQVPATCGLILRGPSGWRYAKKPVLHQLTELPWQAWIKLLLDGVERANGTRREAYFNQWSAEKKLRERFGDDVARMLSDLQGLPARYQAAMDEHELKLKTLKELRARVSAENQEVREQAREACSGNLAKLAVALGLPADALVSDLNGRANQVLRLLRDSPESWRRHPLLDLADRMESVAREAREVGAALSGARSGAAEEGAQA
jgi:hypothetical protein